jgi:hypothetical protein
MVRQEMSAQRESVRKPLVSCIPHGEKNTLFGARRPIRSIVQKYNLPGRPYNNKLPGKIRMRRFLTTAPPIDAVVGPKVTARRGRERQATIKPVAPPVPAALPGAHKKKVETKAPPFHFYRACRLFG